MASSNGDILKKVKAGDKQISAQTFNCLIDVAQFVRTQQQSRKGGPLVAPSLDTGRALIQNKTETDLDRFAVVGLDAPIILPSDDADHFAAKIAIKGLKPTLADHTGKFAILVEPAAQDNIATAIVAGCCTCKLNVVSEAHRFADVAAEVTDSLKTQGSPGGARILWKESGTGTGKWAIVRLQDAERGVNVIVTSPATGLGNHNGNIWDEPTAAIDPAAPLSGTSLGSAGEEVLICCSNEINLAVHTDLTGRIMIGRLLPVKSTDGKRVVMVDSYPDTMCGSL